MFTQHPSRPGGRHQIKARFIINDVCRNQICPPAPTTSRVLGHTPESRRTLSGNEEVAAEGLRATAEFCAARAALGETNDEWYAECNIRSVDGDIQEKLSA